MPKSTISINGCWRHACCSRSCWVRWASYSTGLSAALRLSSTGLINRLHISFTRELHRRNPLLHVVSIGTQFYRKLRVEVPAAYLWGIRLGILLFVIFAFEGYGMGAIKAHTVGGPDGGEGLPFVNWSTKHGDL